VTELEAKVGRAYDDLVALGLLIKTAQLNRNGNAIYIKTAKAKAMGDAVFADALELAFAGRGVPGSAEASIDDSERPPS
jgi:hypothetical protein